MFKSWSSVPLRTRQVLTLTAWRLYLPLHVKLLGRTTAVHRDASPEYHALTTVLWWGRMFPVTVRQMRFSLGQLGVWHPPEAYPQCLRRHGGGGTTTIAATATADVGAGRWGWTGWWRGRVRNAARVASYRPRHHPADGAVPTITDGTIEGRGGGRDLPLRRRPTHRRPS